MERLLPPDFSQPNSKAKEIFLKKQGVTFREGTSSLARDMKCSMLGICVALLGCLVVGSWGGNCDYKFPSGNYYNLQALASKFTQSNPATATYADSKYLWAPCNIIPPSTCNSVANAGMCQVISTRGYNLGMGPTPTWTEGNKICSFGYSTQKKLPFTSLSVH